MSFVRSYRVRDHDGNALRMAAWVPLIVIIVHRADLSPPIVHVNGCMWGCDIHPIPPAVERHQTIAGCSVLHTDDCCMKCARLSRESANRMRRDGSLPNLSGTLRLHTETLDPLHHTWLGVLDAELGELEAPRSSCDALASLRRRSP